MNMKKIVRRKKEKREIKERKKIKRRVDNLSQRGKSSMDSGLHTCVYLQWRVWLNETL
jgi:hypothetical protein